MIKKSIFEDEIIAGMEANLRESTKPDLGQAVDYLNSAIDIFEDVGMKSEADKVLNFLNKIAKMVIIEVPKNFDATNLNKKLDDWHIKGLTSRKEVENLKDHGTQFNMSDDVLHAEVNDELMVDEDMDLHDFEDEK